MNACVPKWIAVLALCILVPCVHGKELQVAFEIAHSPRARVIGKIWNPSAQRKPFVLPEDFEPLVWYQFAVSKGSSQKKSRIFPMLESPNGKPFFSRPLPKLGFLEPGASTAFTVDISVLRHIVAERAHRLRKVPYDHIRVFVGVPVNTSFTRFARRATPFVPLQGALKKGGVLGNPNRNWEGN